MPVVESGHMGDAERKPTLPEEPFGSAKTAAEEPRNWTPMIVGAVVVIVAVALIVIFARNKTTPNRPDPYVARLQVSGLHMSTAQNFAGGSVTYIEGTLANTGDKKVTGASMQVVFKNSLGEIVQDEVLPTMVIQPEAPIVDYGPMDRAPLGPGQARNFRLTLEHVTADWNGQIPQVKVVSVGAS